MSPSENPNRFRQLTITHALMVAADAAMVVALANSFFFDVDPNAARSRTLAFLLVSFAPFVVIAPLIGPLIDRVPGGRRAVVAGVAALRVVTQIGILFAIDSFMLFPLVFVVLVLQKTYTVSKQALVPAAVSDPSQLVEANAKLGVIAGLAGAISVAPAGLLQMIFGSRGPLVLSAILFAIALATTRSLPSSREPTTEPDPDVSTASTKRVELAWAAMFVLRALAGYMLFYVAFWFRGDESGSVYLGLAVAGAGVGTFAGNVVAPPLARRIGSPSMMLLALAVPTVAGLAALIVRAPLLAIVVAWAVNFGAAIGRLSFESTIQHESPGTAHGATFARFETRFQLGWVIAALVPVMLEIPESTGLVVVGATAATAGVVYLVESRRPGFTTGRRRPEHARSITPQRPTR